jgi:cell division protein FtsI (penicillin-binding protein 3)
MVAAFGTIANGGVMMQPRLVRSVFDAQGREIRRVPPVKVRQVISPETARVLTQLLVRVVDTGTGRLAAIPGYQVAGKTGTAQKLDPNTRRYSRAPGVLSFVGFAPADEPRFAMLVLVDEPRTERWGSEAAAPIFATIGREIMRSLEIPPRDTPPVQIVTGPGPESPAELPVRLVSAAGETVMPNLKGRALRSALAALEPLGLRVAVTGRGVVAQQTPTPGVAVEPGATARLMLAPPSRGGR